MRIAKLALRHRGQWCLSAHHERCAEPEQTRQPEPRIQPHPPAEPCGQNPRSKGEECKPACREKKHTGNERGKEADLPIGRPIAERHTAAHGNEHISPGKQTPAKGETDRSVLVHEAPPRFFTVKEILARSFGTLGMREEAGLVDVFLYRVSPHPPNLPTRAPRCPLPCRRREKASQTDYTSLGLAWDARPRILDLHPKKFRKVQAMHVGTFMTRDPITVSEDTSMKDAMLLLRTLKIRHLPVANGKQLVGLVSDRDIRRASPSLLSGIGKTNTSKSSTTPLWPVS